MLTRKRTACVQRTLLTISQGHWVRTSVLLQFWSEYYLKQVIDSFDITIKTIAKIALFIGCCYCSLVIVSSVRVLHRSSVRPCECNEIPFQDIKRLPCTRSLIRMNSYWTSQHFPQRHVKKIKTCLTNWNYHLVEMQSELCLNDVLQPVSSGVSARVWANSEQPRGVTHTHSYSHSDWFSMMPWVRAPQWNVTDYGERGGGGGSGKGECNVFW